jgi:phosphoribosylformimino-5-aminoimidazole carboxamide ribotide isomerase
MGDAGALARAYQSRAGVAEIYVADLDAIAGRRPHDFTDIRSAGVPLLVDAGTATIECVSRMASASDPPVRAVLGLETLTSLDDLAVSAATVGSERTVFSLDLRAGRPLLAPDAAPDLRGLSPCDLAKGAEAAGAGGVMLLDLARVGAGVGVDWELVAELRAALGGAELLVGGGVRGVRDIERLALLGCDGVLVGSAFHEGWLPGSVAPTALEVSRE